MKTIIQKTIWLLFIAVAITSCSKENDDCNPDDEESPCYAGPSGGMLLLVEEKQSDFTYTYTYDERNRMIRWDLRVGDGSGSVDFTYDNNDRLIALDRRDGQGTVTSKETYTYGNGDRPVSGTATVNPGGDAGTGQIQFTYSQNTVVETFGTPGGAIGYVNTYIHDSNGNIVSEQAQYYDGSLSFLFEFGDYDDHPAAHQKWPFSWRQKWNNNYQSYKSTTVNGIQYHRYEYTYNNAGYPIKADIYDRQTGVQVNTRTYSYKKANETIKL